MSPIVNNPYGCGRALVIRAPSPIGNVSTTCGAIVHGEYVQCEECQERCPAPELPDPDAPENDT